MSCALEGKPIPPLLFIPFLLIFSSFLFSFLFPPSPFVFVVSLAVVADPLTGEESKIGEQGNIVVRGPPTFQGYEGDPEATAASFIGDWFKTGDNGWMDKDGYQVFIINWLDLVHFREFLPSTFALLKFLELCEYRIRVLLEAVYPHIPLKVSRIKL